MTGMAARLAGWTDSLHPGADDLALAQRALVDTVAVALAARDEPILPVARELGEAGRWAVAAHILDYDDLHMPSTTHISTVCVPVALATGGGPSAYLAGAGVMARLGTTLGWSHYTAGWHATTTSGALAAAATAATALGLDAERTTAALALAVPASGGVQAAFGTDAKSLQVGFAADAGVRAARLAAAGASADPGAVDAWLALLRPDVGSDPDIGSGAPAIPGGLAIKLHPCCYALQRPLAATASVRERVRPDDVERIVVRTCAGAVTPLHHHRPTTGLQGKFSLEYAVAAALLDDHQGFASFTDDAVRRPAARRLVELVDVHLDQGGGGLLDGTTAITFRHAGGDEVEVELDLPPGAPARPPTSTQLERKVADCLAGTGIAPADLSWEGSADLLRTLP